MPPSSPAPADAPSFASAQAIAALEARGIEPLVAVGRTRPHQPSDFRPPTDEPWRLARLAKPDTPDAQALHDRFKQTVEAVFSSIEAAHGFTRFHLRGPRHVLAEWTLIGVAYDCRRPRRLRQA